MSDHGPGIRIPPPVMVGGALLVAWVLHRLVPVPLGPPLSFLGWFGVLRELPPVPSPRPADLWTARYPRPDKPDSVFVEAGPYRVSRNPIYLGLLVATVGFALRWGELWGWLAVAASHLMLDRLVVAKEEAYLATRFGAAYEAYRSRVRRWL